LTGALIVFLLKHAIKADDDPEHNTPAHDLEGPIGLASKEQDDRGEIPDLEDPFAD